MKIYNVDVWVCRRTFAGLPFVIFLAFLLAAAGCKPDAASDKAAATASGIAKGETGSPSGKRTPLAKEQVMALAEKYVAEQGYTNHEIDIKRKPITFEPGEFATDTNSIVMLRHNTLKGKAFGARQYGNDGQWAVGFEYVNDEPNIGKVVSVGKYGDIVFMQKDQLRLNWLYEKD